MENRPQAVAAARVLTREQRLHDQLAQAEAALQRGELASPPGKSAVDLFRGALELDPGNTLAKGGPGARRRSTAVAPPNARSPPATRKTPARWSTSPKR